MKKKQEYYEFRLRMLNRSRGKCEVCGKPITFETMQLAHKIPQTKFYLRHYGKKVLHNANNLVVCCSLRCNSAVLLSPATHPIEAKKLIEKIQSELEKEKRYGK